MESEVNLTNLELGLLEKSDSFSLEILGDAVSFSEKHLDHQYAANEHIANKARVAIASVIAVLAAILPFVVSTVFTSESNRAVAVVLVVLAIISLIMAYWYFISIIQTSIQFHSGIPPQNLALVENLEEVLTEKAIGKGEDEASPKPDDLQLATHKRVLVYALGMYQRHIDTTKITNQRFAKNFNRGLFSVTAAAALWAMAYLVAKAPI